MFQDLTPRSFCSCASRAGGGWAGPRGDNNAGGSLPPPSLRVSVSSCLRVFVCARAGGGWVASLGVHPSASPPRLFVPSCLRVRPAPAVGGRALVKETKPDPNPIRASVSSCLRAFVCVPRRRWVGGLSWRQQRRGGVSSPRRRPPCAGRLCGSTSPTPAAAGRGQSRPRGRCPPGSSRRAPGPPRR